MKTKKILSVLFGCMAAMCVTSCLGSDDSEDNQGLTAADIQQCFSQVKGNYEGLMLYPATNMADVNDISDTVDVSWEILSDSVMTIHRFPTRLLAEYVNNEQLKVAMQAAPDMDLKCYIGFFEKSPVEFLINPVTPSYDIEYSGGQHNIKVAFYVNNYYSYGVLDQTDNRLEMQIVEGAIFVDDVQTYYLSKQTPFVLLAKQRW